MNQLINLDAKELRGIVAKALGLQEEKVVNTRFGIAIKETPMEEIERRIKALQEREGD